MRGFLSRRLAALVPVLIGVSVVIFLLMHLAPGDVTTTLLGPQATEADRAALRVTLGLDQPVPVQYARWVAQVAQGDLGTSIATSRPVASLILPRFLNTVLLTAASLTLAVGIGYGAGLIAALRTRSALDRVLTGMTLLLGSTPPFWLGLVLVLFFALRLHWLPVSGMTDMAGDGGVLDVARHLVLPAVTTALGPAAIITRLVRSSVLEAMGRPHVRVARAKGLGRAALLRRHVILNALPPIMTITGLQLGYLARWRAVLGGGVRVAGAWVLAL